MFDKKSSEVVQTSATRMSGLAARLFQSERPSLTFASTPDRVFGDLLGKHSPQQLRGTFHRIIANRGFLFRELAEQRRTRIAHHVAR